MLLAQGRQKPQDLHGMTTPAQWPQGTMATGHDGQSVTIRQAKERDAALPFGCCTTHQVARMHTCTGHMHTCTLAQTGPQWPELKPCASRSPLCCRCCRWCCCLQMLKQQDRAHHGRIRYITPCMRARAYMHTYSLTYARMLRRHASAHAHAHDHAHTVLAQPTHLSSPPE